MRGVPETRGGGDALALAVGRPGVGRERESQIVVGVAGVATGHRTPGEKIDANRSKMTCKLAHGAFGIVEMQVGPVLHIQQRRVDGDLIAQHRPDRECVQTSLQLLAAIEDDVLLRRPSGLVVAHERRATVSGDVQAVDVPRDAEIGLRNSDLGIGVPGLDGIGPGLGTTEGDLAVGARIARLCVTMLESPVAQLARRIERAPPNDRRRNGPLALPPLRHIGAGGVDCSGDLRLGRGRRTAVLIERPERALQRHVHEIAEFQRIEHQGVFAAFGRAPAQAVPPRETQRIAQQLTQRARRLGTFDDGAQYGVVGPYQAVVGRQLLAPPVSPAAMCGPGLSRGSKLAGSRRQSVGLAEGIFRPGIARQVGRGRMLTKQDAATQEPPVTVAPRVGEDDLTLRGCQNGREVSPVGVTDRQRIELGSGNDVIGEEAVLRDSARPARGVESEQAHVAARGKRRARSRASRRPRRTGRGRRRT